MRMSRGEQLGKSERLRREVARLRDHAAVLDLGGRAQLRSRLVHVQRPGAVESPPGPDDRTPAPRTSGPARTPTPQLRHDGSGLRDPARQDVDGHRVVSTVTARQAAHKSAIRDVEDLGALEFVACLASSAAALSLRTLFSRPPRRPTEARRRPYRELSTTPTTLALAPPVPAGHRGDVYRCGPIPCAWPCNHQYTRRPRRRTTALGDFSRVRKPSPARGLRRPREARRSRGRDGRRPGRGGSTARQVQNDMFDVCGPVQPITSIRNIQPLRVTDHTSHDRGMVRRLQRGACRSSTVHLPGRPPGAAYLNVSGRRPPRPSGPVCAAEATQSARTDAAQYLNALACLSSRPRSQWAATSWAARRAPAGESGRLR